MRKSFRRKGAAAVVAALMVLSVGSAYAQTQGMERRDDRRDDRASRGTGSRPARRATRRPGRSAARRSATPSKKGGKTAARRTRLPRRIRHSNFISEVSHWFDQCDLNSLERSRSHPRFKPGP